MAFFVTARLTGMYSDLFNAMGLPVVEMHSRKSQSARTKAADQFRGGTRCIMFSSDVSARGVDYPDVTLVLQARRAPGATHCAGAAWPGAQYVGSMHPLNRQGAYVCHG